MSELDLTAYRQAPGGRGPLAGEWGDRPHRLLYDLIAEIERLRDEVMAGELREAARAERMVPFEFEVARASDTIPPPIPWDEGDYEVAQFARRCTSDVVAARRIRLHVERESQPK